MWISVDITLEDPLTTASYTPVTQTTSETSYNSSSAGQSQSDTRCHYTSRHLIASKTLGRSGGGRASGKRGYWCVSIGAALSRDACRQLSTSKETKTDTTSLYTNVWSGSMKLGYQTDILFIITTTHDTDWPWPSDPGSEAWNITTTHHTDWPWPSDPRSKAWSPAVSQPHVSAAVLRCRRERQSVCSSVDGAVSCWQGLTEVSQTVPLWNEAPTPIHTIHDHYSQSQDCLGGLSSGTTARSTGDSQLMSSK